MLLDDNLIFFEDAALSGSIASAPVPLTSLKKPGRAEPICVCCRVMETAQGGTSLTLKLQESDTETGTYADVAGSSETIPAAALTKGNKVYLRWLPGAVAKSWLKCAVTASGTFTAGKLTCAIVREDDQPYEAGLYIDKGQVVG